MEQWQEEYDEKKLNEVLSNVQKRYSETKFVPEAEYVQDEQIANIDFSIFKEGESTPFQETHDFDLPIGLGRSLPEFEALVKETKVGEKGEREIILPENFLEEELAGQKCRFTVSVNAVKRLILPSLDEIAKKTKLTAEQLCEHYRASLKSKLERDAKERAQSNLIGEMLKMVDFPLPQSFVAVFQELHLNNLKRIYENKGISLSSTNMTEEEIKKEYQPQAEYIARERVLCLAIAHKENLQVEDKEIQNQIMKEAQSIGKDYVSLRKNYENNGWIYWLRDTLLVEKALDLIYARAKVNVVLMSSEELKKKQKEAEPSKPEVEDQAEKKDVGETSQEGEAENDNTHSN